MTIGAVNASQIWAILARHAQDEIANLRLQELCRDDDRVSSLVTVLNTTFEAPTHPQPVTRQNRMLIADLSRQRMTLETLNHLLNLSSSRNLRKFIAQLAWGQNNPLDPVVPTKYQATGTAAAAASTESTARNGTGKTPRRKGDKSKATRFESESGRPKPSAIDTNAVATQETSCPSMHMALRVPNREGYEMFLRDGSDALEPVHSEWDRLEFLSDAMRRGQLRGVTGSTLTDVIVVGRGVAMSALQFVDQALRHDERAVLASRAGLVEGTTTRLRRIATNQPTSLRGRRIRFLTRVDPISTSHVVEDLDPASTLVISWALQGNEETGLATKLLKSWLLQELGTNRRPGVVLSKHMLLVTGNDHVASIINKPESVHLIPEHTRCEAFTSFSAATLLPLSIVFGWPLVQEFLAGAHDMDKHFVDTNPRHNLPVLLALSDIWNDIFLNASARVILPFTEAFGTYPAFVSALETQTCGNTTTRSTGQPNAGRVPSCSAFVIDGGLDSVQDRAFYQSDKVLNQELVMVLDTQVKFHVEKTLGNHSNIVENIQAAEDALIVSFFAHADELAFGYDRIISDPVLPSPMSVASVQPAPEPEISRGNRPSTLLICGKLDAFACGQLIALAEHRAVVKAHIWGIDPFSAEPGVSLRMQRTDHLKDDLETLFSAVDDNDSDDEEAGVQNHNMNLSTRTILKHYARMKRGIRAPSATSML
jgi:glucose-6-phosphate isomerase